MAATPASFTLQQMQPFARSSHSVLVVLSWETVRERSMSVVLPNSGGLLVVFAEMGLEGICLGESGDGTV